LIRIDYDNQANNVLRGEGGFHNGQHGSSSGLTARHAKLAVGVTSTLTVFLFETHEETKGSS